MKVLQVKIIGRHKSGARAGQYIYPAFDSMDVITESGISVKGFNWGVYIKMYGQQMYDRTSLMGQVSIDSPIDTYLMMLVVPDAFADEAVIKFPDECSILTDATAKTFYEDKVSINEATEIIDKEVVDGLVAKKALGLALSVEQEDAINPATSTKGIRPNPLKTWADAKIKLGITIT